jgi:hypothetical protein
MSYGSEFVLTLFTNDAALAQRADAAGIDRIGIDLEKIAKGTRQDARKTWISDHQIGELPAVREALSRAKAFARVDPDPGGLKDQVDRLVAMGAQVLMLPYFHDAEHAARFIDAVDGRATVSLLVETAQAAARIRDIVRLDGVDEIHVGLNDLHLTLGLRSHFEVLASAVLDMLSDVVCGSGIPFGFGGIGRLGDDRLPVPSDLVYAQHPRLGSTRALVSRVFLAPDSATVDLGAEVAQFRNRMDYWAARSAEELAAAREALHRQAKHLAKK